MRFAYIVGRSGNMIDFEQWYEQEIGSENKPEYEAAKWAWEYQQKKLDCCREENKAHLEKIDEALTYLRHTDFRECKESMLFNILKGNKDD